MWRDCAGAECDNGYKAKGQEKKTKWPTQSTEKEKKKEGDRDSQKNKFDHS